MYLDAIVSHFRPLRRLGVVLAPLRGCLSPLSVHLVEVFWCNSHAFSTFSLLGATLAVLGAIFLLPGVRLVGAFRCNCFACSTFAPSWCRSGVSWGVHVAALGSLGRGGAVTGQATPTLLRKIAWPHAAVRSENLLGRPSDSPPPPKSVTV